MLHQDFHQTTLFIDGIDFRIQNPVPHAPQKWKHESFKSYKFKQRFALGYILCCDMDDIITFVSDYYPSNRGDSWRVKHCWSDITVETFHEDYDAFAGDTKFTFLRKDPYNCTCFTPHIKPRNGQLTPEQKRYNKALSNYRGNEERVFGTVRNMFKMFNTNCVFRGPPKRHKSYLRLAVAIYNTEKRIKLSLPYDF